MRSERVICSFIFLCLSTLAWGQTPNADSLLSRADELSRNAEYAEAAGFYQQAMKLFLEQDDSVKWIEAGLGYGETFIDRGEVNDGLQIFREMHRQLPEDTPGSLRARTFNNLGLAHCTLEECDVAKDWYLKGLELAEQSGDTLIFAKLKSNLAIAENYLGNFDKALIHLNESRKIFESMGDQYRLAIILSNSFSILSDLGLFGVAEEYLRKSLVIREEIQNLDLLDVGYHNMAWLFNKQGKTDSAIIYYQKSLDISRRLQNPYDIPSTLLNIGSLYEKSGDLEKALLYYNEALEFNQKTERPLSIANNLARIAKISMLKGDLDVSEAFYRQSLKYLEGTQNTARRGAVTLEYAKVKNRQGLYDEAKDMVAFALEVGKEKKLPSLQSDALTCMGLLKKQNNDLSGSLSEFKRAYQLSRRETLADKLDPTINLAKAYQRVGSDSAFIFAKKAFTIIDSVRTNVVGLNFRAGFFREHANFYNEVASWYVNMKGDPVTAISLIEAAKARVLMDELSVAENRIYEQLDEPLLIRKQQYLKEIDDIHSAIRETASDTEKRDLQNKLKDLEFEYQTFVNDLRQKVSDWKEFEYPEPLSTKKIQELLSPGSGILEYSFANEELYIFLILHNEIRVDKVDSIQGESAKTYLTRHIRNFRKQIIQKERRTETKTLFGLLIDDEFLRSRNIKKLLIVPEGVLSYLPFEALEDDQGYLIEHYMVKYLPSISIYPWLKDPDLHTDKRLLAVAGTGFENVLKEGTKKNDAASKYTPLPSTLLEVDSIAVLFNQSVVLKNEEVKEEAIKGMELSQYRYLHFATHAIIDEGSPSQSGLVLGQNVEYEMSVSEDEYLNSNEIQSLNLGAELVTLSACNTAMGKMVSGEGLLGLQRSFLTAGSSAVMASLWSVYDRSTSVFMTHFYKNMLGFEEEEVGMWDHVLSRMGWYTAPLFDYKARALQETKLAMIRHPYYSEPVYWAPFILIGK